MPWCEDCARYWAPSAMTEAGECPACRRVPAPPTVAPTITRKNLDVRKMAAGEDADADVRAPWHFKVLVVLTVAYLAWRIIQLVT